MVRSKCNLLHVNPLPVSYNQLSPTEQEAVKRAFKAYNNTHIEPYFEIEEFYTEVFRRVGWFA